MMRPLLLLITTLFLTSCSVLEDRSECPCRLHIDLTGLPRSGEADLLLTLKGGSWHERRTCLLSGATERVTLTVPRGEVALLAVCPSAPAYLSDDAGFEIPPGEDCPPLRMGALTVDTRREEAFCKPELHKNYCLLTLKLVSEGPAPFPFAISLEGLISGLSPSGEPREGRFFYRLPPFRDGVRSVSAGIPRQRDGSLRMDILFTDEVLRSFALGEILLRQGYDWSAEDLEDVELELDFARTQLTLRTLLWEETISFEKVL